MLRLLPLLLVLQLAGLEPVQLDLQRGHQLPITQAAMRPGTLLTCDGDALCAWDLTSRALRWQARIGSLAHQVLSADGSTLALVAGYRIEMRSLFDGQLVRNVNAFWVMTGNGARPGFVEGLALSPDGRWIVACGEQIDVPQDDMDSDRRWSTVWFPVDADQARPLDWEPGAVGTDPPDDMEQPARSDRGYLLGMDASGRALVRLDGVVHAVPAPGGGAPQVVPAPPAITALNDARFDILDDERRFAWTEPGHARQVLAVPSRLENRSVHDPADLHWCIRDGLLVAVGADHGKTDGTVGAIWRWRLPGCEPLPVLTVPGTTGLLVAGDQLLAASDPPAGGSAGSRPALLTWGAGATIVGAPQPLARVPDFPSLDAVGCDSETAWIQTGGRWLRFRLADGADVPVAGGPPDAPPGSDFADIEAADVYTAPVDASAVQRQQLIAHDMHPYRMHEDSLGRPFAWAWLAADGNYGWSASGTHLFLFRVAEQAGDDGPQLASTRHDLVAHCSQVTGAALTPDRRMLVTVGGDGIAAVWRLPASLWTPVATGEPELLYRRITTRTRGWLAMAPDGIYAGTRDAIDGVAARRGPDVFPASQVELTHHRPDLLQARIGLTPQARIDALRRAWELRLRRMHLDPAQLEHEAPPHVRFDQLPPLSTADAEISLAISGSDPAVPLARLLVTVDGNPVPDRDGLGRGRPGVAIADGGRSLSTTVRIALAHGLNTIDVTAVNEHGVEGPTRRLAVNRTGTAVPRLVVVGIGVSHYTHAEYDLRHAAGDAARATAALGALPGFAGSEVLLLRDGEATRGRILALRERIAATTPDDIVVLFMAGHGVLDAHLDWWFLTHDGDPEHPAAACVSYHEVEGLLDGIPARRRLLLMDACHAGEVDAASAVPPPGVKVRAMRGLKRVDATGSAEDAALMRDTFIDLRRAAGAVVIAASAGQEVAYEDDSWQGGAFTRALLDTLADPSADSDGDHALSAQEWRAAVAQRVRSLTGGLQVPVQRADNPLVDIVLRRW
jgi:hypothetical protein